MCSPHTFWTILFLAGENCSALSGLQAICHLINCVTEVSIDNLHSSPIMYVNPRMVHSHAEVGFVNQLHSFQVGNCPLNDVGYSGYLGGS